MVSMLGGLLLGFLLGMRHACEPDHLAAIATLVTRHRRPRAGLFVGMVWGTGHTVSLLVVGLVLAALQTMMPPRLADTLEFGVAVMLVVLGCRAIVRAVRLGHSQHEAGSHAAAAHPHSDQPDHLHLGQWAIARQPFIVGLIHGLAGSGALTALALASMPTVAARIGYIALFGCGSVLGMGGLSGVAGIPLSRVPNSRAFGQGLPLVTGCVSLVVGLLWGWPLLHGWMR